MVQGKVGLIPRLTSCLRVHGLEQGEWESSEERQEAEGEKGAWDNSGDCCKSVAQAVLPGYWFVSKYDKIKKEERRWRRSSQSYIIRPGLKNSKQKQRKTKLDYNDRYQNTNCLLKKKISWSGWNISYMNWNKGFMHICWYQSVLNYKYKSCFTVYKL